MARLLGLDWGSERIGVAVSDDLARLAVGYGILSADANSFFPALERIVKAEDIRLIVVGYPLNLKGEAGPKAKEVDRFIRRLIARGYPVERWDERLTTWEASRALSAEGVSQKKQRGKLDMAAATLMLQSYLDAATNRERGD